MRKNKRTGRRIEFFMTRMYQQLSDYLERSYKYTKINVTMKYFSFLALPPGFMPCIIKKKAACYGSLFFLNPNSLF
jgi:hypothetical protein